MYLAKDTVTVRHQGAMQIYVSKLLLSHCRVLDVYIAMPSTAICFMHLPLYPCLHEDSKPSADKEYIPENDDVIFWLTLLGNIFKAQNMNNVKTLALLRCHRRRSVAGYRRFGTVCRSTLQVSRILLDP